MEHCIMQCSLHIINVHTGYLYVYSYSYIYSYLIASEAISLLISPLHVTNHKINKNIFTESALITRMHGCARTY